MREGGDCCIENQDSVDVRWSNLPRGTQLERIAQYLAQE